MSVVQDLTDSVTPIVDSAGCRLWDLKLTKAGKRSIVAITIDKDGGPTLDEIADVSKQIAPVLDEHPSLENAYHLEVSSPGLERPLTSQNHYEWSKNLEVAVSHRVDGTLTRSRGVLKEVTDSKLTIETENQTIEIEIDSITKAHTIFDFAGAMKQGSKKSDHENDGQGDNEHE